MQWAMILFFIVFSVIARTHHQTGHESDFLPYVLVAMIILGTLFFDRKKKEK